MSQGTKYTVIHGRGTEIISLTGLIVSEGESLTDVIDRDLGGMAGVFWIIKGHVELL